MKELGVKRIIYSVEDDIVKINLKDFRPTCFSLGRQFIQNGCHTIHRDRIGERQITYDNDTDSYITDNSSVSSDETIGEITPALRRIHINTKKRKHKKRKKNHKHKR